MSAVSAIYKRSIGCTRAYMSAREVADLIDESPEVLFEPSAEVSERFRPQHICNARILGRVVEWFDESALSEHIAQEWMR